MKCKIAKWHLSHFGNYSPWCFHASKLSFVSGSCKTQERSFGKPLSKAKLFLVPLQVHTGIWGWGMCGASCSVTAVGWACPQSRDVSAPLVRTLHTMAAALLRALEKTTSSEIHWPGSLRAFISKSGPQFSWFHGSIILKYMAMSLALLLEMNLKIFTK